MSPRFIRPDNLDVKDIKGAQPEIHKKQKNLSTRDHLNISDIIEESKGFKRRDVGFNKNKELLTDEVLGRKKSYNKQSSPLDPQYIMSTKSRRMIVIGEVDGGKPKQFVKRDINKDTKRYMRVDDISGAQPKLLDTIPENKLANHHPMFQDPDNMQRDIKEHGNLLKLRN